ncbi:hypothetical protein C9J48_02720 [Photobacterium profundum]|uniref:Uncharacterized protein n=1 Tax=Photobacterium profundum 3TCK TaxID=314280 RepID=Q1Z5F9_9GAMM|nr:hypothetical protein P3TCK_16494 [Photobacterium profundum 3TCK]PSV64379.1 hypothetical protein C9J48_02720 [Photobacterium profundum]
MKIVALLRSDRYRKFIKKQRCEILIYQCFFYTFLLLKYVLQPCKKGRYCAFIIPLFAIKKYLLRRKLKLCAIFIKCPDKNVNFYLSGLL